jgi:hypothetical protein
VGERAERYRDRCEPSGTIATATGRAHRATGSMQRRGSATGDGDIAISGRIARLIKGGVDAH